MKRGIQEAVSKKIQKTSNVIGSSTLNVFNIQVVVDWGDLKARLPPGFYDVLKPKAVVKELMALIKDCDF